jgi:hypothetical protein
MSDEMAQAFAAVARGVNINADPQFANKFRARRATFFHKVAVPDAGFNNIPLFNAAIAEGVTNLPQPGFIPSEQPMWLTDVSIHVKSGLTLANVPAAAGTMVTGTVANAIVVGNDLDAIIAGTQFRLKVGDYTVIDNQGLEQFPAGGGPFYTNANFTGIFTASVNNGWPDSDNNYKLRPWYPILPQKQIVGSLTNAALINFTDAQAFTIKVTLGGIQVTPANL